MLQSNNRLQNRYQIIRPLGHGGMGTVYEARDERTEAILAIKEISLDANLETQKKEAAKIAFEREAKTLAKLKHESIPHIIDYFSEADKQFLVMELVQGKDLGETLEQSKKPFTLFEINDWINQLFDALDYLHTHNPPIIHRDLKPNNLKLTARNRIKLLDFGIAKSVEGTVTTTSNQTFIAATLNFSPVEQLLRVLDPTFREVITQKHADKVLSVLSNKADQRSDLYALGATLYHLLTGILPAHSVKRALALWENRPDPLKNPSSLSSNVPFSIANILLKSLAVEPENRYASAIAMQKDWQAAIKAIEAEKDSFSNEITLRIDKKELKNAETINQSEALQNTESLVATKLLENQRETSPQNQNLTISKTPKKRFGLVIAGLSFALMMIGGIGVFALWMMQKNSNLDLKTEPVLIENEKKSVSLPTPEIKKTEVESTTTSPLQKTENKIDTQPPEKKAPPQVIEKPNTVATKSKEVATKPTPKKQTKKPVSVDDIINDN